MKTIKASLTLLVVAFGFITQQQAAAQHLVQNSVFGNGGWVISGDSFSIGSTAGQPVVGVMSDPSTRSGIGFWYISKGLFTGVEQTSGILPKRYWLGQNYPNPFNLSTTITFYLPENALVELKVFDTLGREVQRLVKGTKNLGQHRINLDLPNAASGTYLYQIKANAFVATKRLTLLK